MGQANTANYNVILGPLKGNLLIYYWNVPYFL